MPVDPLTHRQLLELVYDLLAEPEAAELRRRIQSDPELAAAYGEAQRTADLLAEASRREAPKVDLRRVHRAAAPAEAARGRPARSRSSPWARGANWAVSIAATVLLAFSLGGYIYHRRELADLAASHMRLLVTGPSRLQSGMANTYTIAASTVTGAPLATKIELALYSPAGKPLLRQEEDTDAEGRARVRVPAELSLSGSARLEVSAIYRNKREKLAAELPVAPVRYAAHLELDRTWYRPGDTVRVRAVVLSRFSLTGDRDLPVQLSIADGAGQRLSGFPREIRTDHGVAQSQWSIPRSLPGGHYALLVQSPGGLFAPKSQAVEIRADERAELDKQLEFSRPVYRAGETVVAYFAARRRDGRPATGARLTVLATVHGAAIYQASPAPLADGPLAIRFPLPPSIAAGDARLAVTVLDAGRSETMVRPIPLAPARIEVRFQPEDGPLVAGLRNRVYFTASDGSGQPVELRGVVVDSRDQEVADLETAQAGMGLFSIAPSAGEQYRVRIITPVGATDEPALPEVSGERKVVLATGPGVFPAGRPLEFQIDSLRGGLPLVVAANCRGVLVGQQALVTNDSEQQNKITLPLAPQACGVIRLTVYEYRTDRPRPVAERLVYRHPERRLQLALNDGQKPYPPGAQMKLSLAVSNEKGEPVQTILGIAAMRDDDSRPAASYSPPMPADFYYDGQVSGAERLGDPNLYLAADPKAATALDLLLGTQIPRAATRPAAPESQLAAADAVAPAEDVEPPTVLDNLGQLRSEYEKNLAAYRAERTKALNTLTTLSFFGGFGLVLLVAMLAALKVVSGIRLWVPAFAAAIACLVVGATLMNPDRFQPGLGAAVAYVPYRGPTELALRTTPETPAPAVTDTARKQPEPQVASEPAMPAGPPVPLAATPLESAPAAAKAAVRADAPPMKRAAQMRQQEVEEAQQGAVRAKSAVSGAFEKGASNRFPLQAKGFFGRAEVRPSEAISLKRKAAVTDEAAAGATISPVALAWRPAVETDALGRSALALELPAAGAYRVRVDGHGAGRLGHAERVFQAQMPCQLEPRIPAELSLGDQLDLPVVVSNPTGVATTVEVALEHGPQLKLQGSAARKLALKPGESRRELFRLEAIASGACPLEFRALAGRHSQSVERSLKVVPSGYPLSRAYSGRLRGDQLLSVDLPQWLPGSLEASFHAQPTLLAELEWAYEAIERQPEGCAEQPAAAAWLAALALEWIQRSDAAWPEVVRRWRSRLDASLVRLARYEAPPRGFGAYQWFGAHPANEALSAFVLATLDDVRRASGRAADEDHLAAWLRGRLDPNGSPRPDPKALAPLGVAPELLGAYITWAVARHDPKAIDSPLKHAAALALKSDNPYQVALAASALLSAGAKAEAALLLDRLASAQRDDGRLEGKQSATGSRDRSLAVQTTALAAIAWLQAGRGPQAERALAWLAGARLADGGFGPPQTTALVMKALAEQAKTHPVEARAGKISLRSGDVLLAEQAFNATDPGPIVMAGLERRFRPGKSSLSLSLAAVGSIGYTLRFRMATEKSTGGACPVALATRLQSPQVRLGQTVGLSLELTNPAEQAAPLVVAVIGLPAGLEPRAEQLEQLKKLGTVDQFAADGRRLALYWRGLQARQKMAFQLELLATASGRFQGPASAAYLYHSPDSKSFAAPLAVEVAP